MLARSRSVQEIRGWTVYTSGRVTRCKLYTCFFPWDGLFAGALVTFAFAGLCRWLTPTAFGPTVSLAGPGFFAGSFGAGDADFAKPVLIATLPSVEPITSAVCVRKRSSSFAGFRCLTISTVRVASGWKRFSISDGTTRAEQKREERTCDTSLPGCSAFPEPSSLFG